MTGFIYAIRCMDRVKIGFSTDPASRLVKIRADNAYECRLLGVVPGDTDYEAELHKRFSEYHVRGEWFTLKGEVAEFVVMMDEPPYLEPQKDRGGILGWAPAGAPVTQDPVEWMRSGHGRQRLVAKQAGLTPSVVSEYCNGNRTSPGLEARILLAVDALATQKAEAA